MFVKCRIAGLKKSSFSVGLLMIALLMFPPLTGVHAREKQKTTPTVRRSSPFTPGHVTRSSKHVKPLPKPAQRGSFSRFPSAQNRRDLHSFSHFRFNRTHIRRGSGYSCFYSFHPSCFRRFRVFSFAYYPLFVPWFYDYSFGFAFGYPYYYGYYYSPYGYPYPYRRPYGWWRFDDDREKPYEKAGEIWFDIKPADALIYVDGELWGQAGELNGWWNSRWIPAGEHTVRVEAPGYDAYETRVHVRPNEKVKIQLKLERAEHAALETPIESPLMGALIIHSTTPIAEVRLNGESIPLVYDRQAGAWVLQVMPGQYQLEIVDRYQNTLIQPVHIRGKYTHLSVVLSNQG